MSERIEINGEIVDVPPEVQAMPGRAAIQSWYDDQVRGTTRPAAPATPRASAPTTSAAPTAAPTAPPAPAGTE